MNYVGIDLHKKSISICVVNQGREVLGRRRFLCGEPGKIKAFFEELGPFQAVLEATGGYEWFAKLIDPLADRVALAHPRKMRIIADTSRKTDKLDAQALAEFLAIDMIPEAYRPTTRQRAHRILVRQRDYLRRRITSVRNKIRWILTNYNADRKDLFTQAGLSYLDQVQVLEADRFALNQLKEEWMFYESQLKTATAELATFSKKAPTEEVEARAVLSTIPYIGPVTVDVVISELADIRRFRSQKKVCAYAGLSPAQRDSDGHTPELGITKEGPGRLRWVLVQAAWRLVRRSARWRSVFEGIARRRGRKRAIVAVARRLLCVMTSMLQTGQAYRPALVCSSA